MRCPSARPPVSAARLLWLILFGLIAASLFAHWAGREQGLQEAPVADVMLAFFLLSPVLNPWYLVWLVPFAAVGPTRRAVALLIVIPLSYATGLNLGDPALETYAQPDWVRPIEFGIVILATLSSVGPMKLALRKIYRAEATLGGGSSLAHEGALRINFPNRILK